MPAPPRTDDYTQPRTTALRDEFRVHHSVRLPALLNATLIASVLEGTKRGTWIGREHDGIGREVILDDARALDVLHFVANTPRLLALVKEITGCDTITTFEGRVYRMVPGADHFDSWHDDVGAHRLVGMSLNLGPDPYEGGTFQLRTDGEHAAPRELPNTVPGDAILFRISPELSHRVTPVVGSEPRTAFAGWFLADGVSYFSRLLDAARERQG